MSLEHDECFQKQKIRKFNRGALLAKKELKTAESDLKRAKTTFAQKDYKWTTIQAYYSMFHSARALLYKKNLRERSHHCLAVAIKELYVTKKLLDYRLLEALERAKVLRENADYYDRFSKESSSQILNKAQDFLNVAKELV